MAIPTKTAIEIQQVVTEVQYPHDVFGHYSRNEPEKFATVLGDTASIKAFWDKQSLDDPRMYKHPLLARPNYRTKCVPCKVHSDGGEMSNSHSCYVISWSSFCGLGSVMDVQFYYASCVKAFCAKESDHGIDTKHILWRRFAWSMSALLVNRHPVVNWEAYEQKFWGPPTPALS